MPQHASAERKSNDEAIACWASQNQDKTAKAALVPEIQHEGGSLGQLVGRRKDSEDSRGATITLAESE